MLSEELAWYARPAVMTAPGPHAGLLRGLPADPAALARIAQGLLIHEHLAGAYGVTLTGEQREAVHIRPVAGLLERVIAADSRPLDLARPPAGRVAANCRQFTVLMVAMLRARGIPARARCGFGGYFCTGMWEDHWVCEAWDAAGQRWFLADAQVDDVQQEMFHPGFDLLDVPRDEFLVAGDAWARVRAGKADPDAFGLSVTGESGDWWIAANLIRDAAALAGMEMLPWDEWGAMPGPGSTFSADLLALLDRLADLTRAPGPHPVTAGSPAGSLAGLRALYQADDRIRVPDVVRNAVRGRDEPPLP